MTLRRLPFRSLHTASSMEYQGAIGRSRVNTTKGCCQDLQKRRYCISIELNHWKGLLVLHLVTLATFLIFRADLASCSGSSKSLIVTFQRCTWHRQPSSSRGPSRSQGTKKMSAGVGRRIVTFIVVAMNSVRSHSKYRLRRAVMAKVYAHQHVKIEKCIIHAPQRVKYREECIIHKCS